MNKTKSSVLNSSEEAESLLLKKAAEIVKWNHLHPDEPQRGLNSSDFTQVDKLRKQLKD